MIPFAEWLPDQPDLSNPGATVAKNVVPAAVGYRPQRSLVAFSDALTARCQGAFSCKDDDEATYNYAGDVSKLYVLNTDTWADASKSATTYATDEDHFWEFVQFKQKVIATGWDDSPATTTNYPQVITLGASNFDNLTAAFVARHVAVVREFVVFGYTYDTGDGRVPERVRWSAQGDETDYVADDATQSGATDLRSGGAIQHITGGEFGIIVCEHSVYRMTYAGPPTIWQFDEIDRGIGTHSPGSVVKHNNVTYFLANDGFRATAGEASTRIGAEKVDRTVLAEIDESNLARVTATSDPVRDLIIWGIPTGMSGKTPDKLYIFHPPTGRWAYVEQDVQFLYQSNTAGIDIDAAFFDTGGAGADLDALTDSLDSSVWVGGNAVLAAFDTDNKLGYFTGTPYTARLETAEVPVAAGARAMVTHARNAVNGGTTTLTLGTRNRQSDATTYHGAQAERTSGQHAFRKNARYARFRADISGEWTHAVGVDDIKANPMGRR
jgi:hypothetical protein